jgi:hypothetical protein
MSINKNLLVPTTLAIVLALSAPLACAAPAPLAGHSLSCGKTLTPYDISWLQTSVKGLPVGERIAFWAGKFVGTPYDTDPLGAYVRSEKVVCDSEVDCMYLVFRAVELATSGTPDEAAERALDLRFTTRGTVVDGKVVNYDERFDYAEDMVASGKWGRDITSVLGKAERTVGSRGAEYVTYLPKSELLKRDSYKELKDGDLIFFIKDPAKRVVGEIVGHLGVIKIEGGTPLLIHGSGTKAAGEKPGGGMVKKVDLLDYVRDMRFIGVMVTRFE